MGSVRDFGLKITSSQCEYYRYTGLSAELEQRAIRSLPRPDFSIVSQPAAELEKTSSPDLGHQGSQS